MSKAEVLGPDRNPDSDKKGLGRESGLAIAIGAEPVAASRPDLLSLFSNLFEAKERRPGATAQAPTLKDPFAELGIEDKPLALISRISRCEERIAQRGVLLSIEDFNELVQNVRQAEKTLTEISDTEEVKPQLPQLNGLLLLLKLKMGIQATQNVLASSQSVVDPKAIEYLKSVVKAVVRYLASVEDASRSLPAQLIKCCEALGSLINKIEIIPYQAVLAQYQPLVEEYKRQFLAVIRDPSQLQVLRQTINRQRDTLSATVAEAKGVQVIQKLNHELSTLSGRVDKQIKSLAALSVISAQKWKEFEDLLTDTVSFNLYDQPAVVLTQDAKGHYLAHVMSRGGDNPLAKTLQEVKDKGCRLLTLKQFDPAQVAKLPCDNYRFYVMTKDQLFYVNRLNKPASCQKVDLMHPSSYYGNLTSLQRELKTPYPITEDQDKVLTEDEFKTIARYTYGHGADRDERMVGWCQPSNQSLILTRYGQYVSVPHARLNQLVLAFQSIPGAEGSQVAFTAFHQAFQPLMLSDQGALLTDPVFVETRRDGWIHCDQSELAARFPGGTADMIVATDLLMKDIVAFYRDQCVSRGLYPKAAPAVTRDVVATPASASTQGQTAAQPARRDSCVIS